MYISAGPLGHQAVGLPLNSFRFMFLIHQALQPPVFCLILQSSSPPALDPPMSFFESSSIRVSEETRFRDSPRAPPSQNSSQASCTRGSLPSWGWIFSDPSRILCAGGPFSATPIAFCASECQKHMGKCSVAIFYTILPLMLAILPVLLAILAPTCSTSARKMPEKCHLGANIAKKVLQPPLQAPQNTKKLRFSKGFCRFSAIQPMCQNRAILAPTWL